MTTALATDARRNAVLFGSAAFDGQQPKMSRRLYKKPDGSTGSALVLDDVAVFRSGTFRDSMGFQHTYESLHMDQMVAHFDMLRNRNILPDIPVRDGHPGFLLSGSEGNGKVVGWHTGLRTEERTSPTDGKDYTYLLASYEILDESAQAAIESGLWRNRSSEVGSYVTNDEAEFWPVYMGFAYVDIPAVEGLNGFSKSNPGLGTKFSLMFESEEEASVAVKKHSQAASEAGSEPAADGEVETIEVTEDGTVLVNGEPEVETPDEGDESETPDEEPEVEGDEEGDSTDGADAQHSRSGGSYMFKVNGQPTADFAAVQRHIETLEGFAKETSDKNRRDFVKSLVDEKKITGAQQSALEEFALGLNSDQYEKWCATFSNAPTLSLFQQHAAGTSNTEPQASAEDSALEIAREIVFSHKRSGMPKEQIEQTPSFKKLKQHDPNFTL